MTKRWNAPLGLDLASLSANAQGTVIEPYSEGRNGFTEGDTVIATLSGGRAVLAITQSTQVNTTGGVDEIDVHAAGYDTKEALLASLPQGKQFVAVIRFRVEEVLENAVSTAEQR